jgi:hypothetical protein
LATEVSSTIGNLADLKEGEIALPKCIVKCDEGLLADLSKLDSSASFALFAERVFSSGSYFSDLDYARFLELLYDYPPEKVAAAANALTAEGKSPLIRFAADILEFDPGRRALYKAARIAGSVAEYVFEPVVTERTVDGPHSEEGENGGLSTEGQEKKTVSDRTSLTFDEFVADMWSKGVRYGIDAAAVRVAIDGDTFGRVVVARQLEPMPGKDAEIQEQMEGLHRDDAPKELANGRIDLKQFKNHFPQVAKGARLLKKIPRTLGMPGRMVDGTLVEPPPPKDFDLATLAGLGAQLERGEAGEFIVASLDGFLSIDTQTNLIAVTEKIVDHGGVSARTTGNLHLTCDEFEEHGEIQEKCIVEGKNITVYADVFGTVISSGGKIQLKQNLVSGEAINHDGDITIDGLVSGAVVHARKGAVTIKRAENSIIVGKRVTIESAAKCDVCGDDVAVENSAGCAIAGKSVRLVTAEPRQERETVVSMLVPDLSGYDQEINAIRKKIEEVESALVRKRRDAASEAAAAQGEARNYLVLEAKLQKKEITLTPEQMANWQKLTARVAPGLKVLNQLNGEVRFLQTEKEIYEGKGAALMQYKQDASAGVYCSIQESHGDTLVRIMKTKPGAVPLADLESKQLKAQLLAPSLPADRLLSGEGGPFEWRYRAQDPEE